MRILLSALLINFIPALLSAQTVSVTFNVRMSYQIDQGNFDPVNEFVDVAGDFNGWGSSLTKLTDTDNDSVYSVTVSGFTPGVTTQFKFRYNGQWDNREEFPGAGNNRSYTVKPDNNSVTVWYNDEVPPNGPPVADFNTATNSYYTNSLVSFRNQSSGRIMNYEWTFTGGTPATSTESEPVIRYAEPGSYDVQLIVSNESESDTLFKNDYIIVRERISSDSKWWNEVVFYEIFVRSFYDSDGDGIGDFNGLTEKLDYLNDGNPDTDSDLGIGGIWLMPIHNSPSYHGYDVTDYRSINPDYGTMEDFKNFLSEAHSRGIKVIIDYVMNHSSSQHPWFQQSAAGNPAFRDFYRWSDTDPGYSGPWGQQVWHPRNGEYYYGLFWGGMPDLNYEHSAVKDSMFAISDFWIKEIGVDGFRQDAVLYIDEDGSILKNTPETFQFWNEFNTILKNGDPNAFAVGEAWEPTEIALQYMSDDRLDYVFEFDLAQAILNGVNQSDADRIISQMQKVYDSYPFLQYGTFLTNHDQNRVMNVLSRDINKAKTAASLFLTLPGIPYLYYGEEVGMLGQKPDEDIRLPMQWSAETYAGFSNVEPWRSPNSNYSSFNVQTMKEDPSSLFNHYRNLINIRNQSPDLKTGEMELGVSSNSNMIAYLRSSDEGPNPTLVVINISDDVITNASAEFSKDLFSITSETAGWISEIIYRDTLSQDEEYFTPFNRDDELQEIQNISIAPWSIEIISFNAQTTPNEEEDIPSELILDQNYPNPFNPVTNISFELPRADNITLKVYDITGRRVATLEDGFKNEGRHTVRFDASGLASGIYFYQLQSSGLSLNKKMTLIK
ncbi:alpha-amylase family glycosyl hydrolase [Balneola sp. MJW-20]|uniref:alpha-amylase family glycosyl hydrolase n=1 Tax=Gracilimonas aurantiaca TaxID=3234185 RepID=UPI00390ACC0A